jgi:asparagine synthase (glutamine-hydrolysing)
MSAIAGIFRFDGRPAELRDLERMMNTLNAHGPDRSGSHVAGPVALGHLLMRVTPEDSFDAQPVRGAGGTVMVADLRIDNREDLISAIGLDPQESMVSSDAAIALAAWQKWGDDAWARLRGPFAIVVWDERNQKLTVVRDPLGVRTLCYYRCDEFLAFSTMPKGLFALGEVPRAINKQKLADFLIFNDNDCETTVYRDISRLHPARAVTVDSKGVLKKRQYWSEENIQPVRLGSSQAYADAMRERLDIAVRRNLRTSHKVGAFLSGGLDSSSVVALGAQALAERDRRLPCYTQVPVAGFQQRQTARKYFDERPYVELIAEMVGNIDVTYVESGECDDFAEIDQILRAIDGPVRNVANLGWISQIYRLARSAGQKVLLEGHFGNISISWAGWEQTIDHARHWRILTAWRQWQLFYNISARSRFGSFRRLFLDPLGLDLRKTLGIGHRQYSLANKEFIAEMKVEERTKRVVGSPQSIALNIRMEFATGNEFRGEWEAGILALYGIDLRDPTSDLDLVQFCFGVPDEEYLAEGIDRSTIRRAMWGILPERVLANRKRGLQAADWLEKIKHNSGQLDRQIAKLRESKLISEALDLDWLQKLGDSLPKVTDAQSSRAIDHYRSALPQALAAGRFVQTFEEGNG